MRGMARLGGICMLVLLAVTGLRAGEVTDEDFDLYLSEEAGIIGGQAVVSLTLDNDGDDLAGWSLAVCHDSAILELPDDEDRIVEGADVAEVNGGAPPAFSGFNIIEDTGWTVGSVVNFGSAFALETGTDLGMYDITYDLIDVGLGTVEFCEPLGDPEVFNEVLVGKEPFKPTFNDGGVDVTDVIPFLFALPGTSEEPVVVQYTPEDGVGSLTVLASIDEAEESPGFPNDTQGFSMDIQHDPALLEATDVVSVGPLPDLREGKGPEYVGVQLDASDTGVTVAVAYVLLGDDTLQFEDATDVLEIRYDLVADAFLDNVDGADSTLEFVDDLGSPPVRNAVVIGGFSDQAVTFDDGHIRFEPVLVPPFIRGDCNGDGRVNLGDGIFWLRYLFTEGDTPPCFEACDVIDDDQDQAGDAIKLFQYLFKDGDAPPAPFPDCGTPEETEIRCESHFCEEK